MSVETLQAGAAMKGVPATASFTSAMPFRILNKGPEYFRREAAPGARKPSAVERLEADKAKYVKSLHVASTKQEPVKPLLKQPLFPLGVRRTMLTPSRKTPAGGRRAEAAGPKTSLNLEILNNLINIRDSPAFPKPASPLEHKWRAEPPEPRTPDGRPAGQRRKGPAEGMSKLSESSVTSKPSSTVAVRRVDVRPCGVLRGRESPAIQVTPVPASPAQARVPSTSSPNRSPHERRADSAKRQTLLHRSKSDLSDRYSRATADLERFFNYCGLDPEEVRDLGGEHFARASSDIVSVKFHSVSTASSEGARSQRSTATLEDKPAERMPYGISVVERNARVIKWLYGLRQAREPQKPALALNGQPRGALVCSRSGCLCD
nr:protein FAM110A [Pelodiscus sinensis]XP_025035400.1 protein FAM110A [Pelodiscus sinensis]|eukprot:XP_025035399.1 protein FAM110A [Pelodiscus sinensis]